MYICLCSCFYMCVFVDTCIPVCVSICAPICVHIRVPMFVSICVCLYVHVCSSILKKPRGLQVLKAVLQVRESSPPGHCLWLCNLGRGLGSPVSFRNFLRCTSFFNFLSFNWIIFNLGAMATQVVGGEGRGARSPAGGQGCTQTLYGNTASMSS